MFFIRAIDKIAKIGRHEPVILPRRETVHMAFFFFASLEPTYTVWYSSDEKEKRKKKLLILLVPASLAFSELAVPSTYEVLVAHLLRTKCKICLHFIFARARGSANCTRRWIAGGAYEQEHFLCKIQNGEQSQCGSQGKLGRNLESRRKLYNDWVSDSFTKRLPSKTGSSITNPLDINTIQRWKNVYILNPNPEMTLFKFH